MKSALGAVAALLLAGCASVPKPGEAPAADAKKWTLPAYPGLTLAVVLNENSRRTAHHARESERQFLGVVKPIEIFDAAQEVLKRNFKSVTPVGSVEEGLKNGADLAAVLDVSAFFPTTVFGELKIDLRVDFTEAKGRVWQARGSGMSVPNKDTAFSTQSQNRLAESYRIASGQALHGLEATMRDSPPMAAFAERRATDRKDPAAAPKIFEAELERPSFRLPDDRGKFALIVAERAAARDARAVKAHLLALGYPERNIVSTTERGLDRALDGWLPKSGTPPSIALVYWGRGSGDPGRMLFKLEAASAGQLVMIVEGPMPQRAASRVEILSAAAAGETPALDQESGLSVFTRRLLEALGEKEGRASLRELLDLVRPKSLPQNPRLSGAGDASL